MGPVESEVRAGLGRETPANFGPGPIAAKDVDVLESIREVDAGWLK